MSKSGLKQSVNLAWISKSGLKQLVFFRLSSEYSYSICSYTHHPIHAHHTHTIRVQSDLQLHTNTKTVSFNSPADSLLTPPLRPTKMKNFYYRESFSRFYRNSGVNENENGYRKYGYRKYENESGIFIRNWKRKRFQPLLTVFENYHVYPVIYRRYYRIWSPVQHMLFPAQ